MEDKKKKNNLPLVVIVIALLAVAGYFVGKELTKTKENLTPKEAFMTSIDKMFSETANIKIDDKEDIETLSASFSVNANVTSSLMDKNILNVINGLKLSGKFDLDKKNETINYNLNGTYNNLNLLDITAYLENNGMYVYLDEIYEKWIKLNEEVNFDFSQFDLNKLNVDASEYISFYDEMVKSFKDSLKDDYFTKEEDGDLTKITLTIDKDNAKDITGSIIDLLDKNSEFKKLYKDNFGSDFGVDSKEITEQLKDNEYNTFATVTMSVFVDDNDNAKKIVITSEMGNEKYGLEIKKIDDNEYEFVVKSNNISIISGSLKSVEKDDTTNIKLKLSIMELIVAEVNMDLSVKVNGKLDKVDVSNSINADDLTEQESNLIEEKLQNSNGIKQLMSDLEKINFDEIVDISDLESGFNY